MYSFGLENRMGSINLTWLYRSASSKDRTDLRVSLTVCSSFSVAKRSPPRPIHNTATIPTEPLQRTESAYTSILRLLIHP